MIKAKQYYLECLKDGPKTHKLVHQRMKYKFDADPLKIREYLLTHGYIEECKKILRSDGKKVSLYRLTKKKFTEKEPVVINDYKWEDGTPKSQGNAFDWKHRTSALFTDKEISITQRKYTPYPITVYSRA